LGLTEFIPCQLQVCLSPGPAGAADLTKPTMRPSLEFALALICLLGYGLDAFTPSQQFIEGQFLSADMVQPGLDDCHSNCLEIVEGAEFVISAQGVQSQLRVPFRIDLHAFAVLQIYNLQHVIADDHRVAGTEPLRYPRRKIQALLDVELSAGNPFFQYHLDVSADILKHFIHSISRLIYLIQQNSFGYFMGFCTLGE